MGNELNYRIKTVKDARSVSKVYLDDIELSNAIKFGLPELDDRYDIWRVPLKAKSGKKVGEIVIDAKTSFIDKTRSTKKKILEARLLGRNNNNQVKKSRSRKEAPKISNLRNTVGYGDSEELLIDTPKESVDLIFTSPPYYNARPEYSEYISYEDYLLKLRKIIQQSHRVLSEGRFFVINISPVLIRRTSRSESSRRIAVPFDLHRIFIEEGFEFIDDIIWEKPEGAGWATSRGRRFSADRNPLQYKAVPVTEYVLVYRKKTDRLIDWHIRKHPDPDLVEESKIEDDYEKTNIWKIHPAKSKQHPAIFPIELAERVIKYYSFKNDVVLDPFAGIGTTGKAAIKLKRRFVLFEMEEKYVKIIARDLTNSLQNEVKKINWVNFTPKKTNKLFLEF
jgi:DNA modification methylase